MSGMVERPPTGFISPSGDVMVPPELARILWTHAHLDDFFRAKGHVRPDLANLLQAFRISGARWAGSDRGSEQTEAPEASGEWMSTKQVALQIGVSTRRVLQMIDSGHLQAEKFAGTWRVAREELRHLRAARQKE